MINLFLCLRCFRRCLLNLLSGDFCYCPHRHSDPPPSSSTASRAVRPLPSSIYYSYFCLGELCLLNYFFAQPRTCDNQVDRVSVFALWGSSPSSSFDSTTSTSNLELSSRARQRRAQDLLASAFVRKSQWTDRHNQSWVFSYEVVVHSSLP